MHCYISLCLNLFAVAHNILAAFCPLNNTYSSFKTQPEWSFFCKSSLAP